MRVWTGMRIAPACVEHRQKVQGARGVRAGQNCGGGRWTGKPQELDVSCWRGNHGLALGVVMKVSGVKRRCYSFRDCHRQSYSFFCHRPNYSSWCVGNVLAFLDACLNILEDVSSAECRCWMNKWLTLWLKPWPFYMVFSLFICPSIGRLARLVGVSISTKVLSQVMWWKAALVSGVVSRDWRL